MNNKPLVSIIIPCYNHENFVADCLKSILQQSYDNIELLICDDCSTDRSYEVIKRFEKVLSEQLATVKIYKNTSNCGVTKNINRMLAESQGEFIKILASDDVLTTDAISFMVSFFKEHKDIDVLIANGAKITEEQHYPKYVIGESIYKNIPKDNGTSLFVKTFIHNDIFAPGAVMRKSVFDVYGLYDEALAIEDLEYWLRILKDGKIGFAFSDQILIYYRVSSNSMTSIKKNAQLEMRRKRFHLAELQILNMYGKYVPENIYAETVMKRIIDEKWLAINNRLHDLEQIVRKEYTDFQKWSSLPWKKQVFYRYKYLKADIKKMYLILFGHK